MIFGSKKSALKFSQASEEILDRLSNRLSEAERENVSDSTWRGVLGDARELSRRASDGEFRQMQALAKAMETCLESAQKTGELAKPTFEKIFQCLEVMTRILANLKAYEEEGSFQKEVEDRVSELFESHLATVGAGHNLKKDTVMPEDDDIPVARAAGKKRR